MPKFILSEFVEPELLAIWDYIAIDNIDAADRWRVRRKIAAGKNSQGRVDS